eukprot:9127678-Alexandrium_andersonii.AAC.1
MPPGYTWSGIAVPTLWLCNEEGAEALAQSLQRHASSDQQLRQLSEVTRARRVTSASALQGRLRGRTEALARAA